jgi:hypothetical protein
VSKTTKYSELESEGYLLSEEPSFVHFVSSFRSKNKKEHQHKASVRMSNTTKYSKGYLLPDEQSVVRFIPGFTCQQQQKHQRKALVCVSKTMKYIEGYIRPEEPSVVQFVRDSQKHKRASVKGLGQREQDHEIHRRILTPWRADFSAIRPRFQMQKQTMASAKGLGQREQDHEILRSILTYWRAECRAICLRYYIPKHTSISESLAERPWSAWARPWNTQRDTYALKSQISCDSSQIIHFENTKEHQHLSKTGPLEQDHEINDNDHDNNQKNTYGLRSRFSGGHPGSNVTMFRARKHNDQVVRVSKATETGKWNTYAL